MKQPMKPPLKLLLASIHDVSPRFETEVDQLLDLLEPHVGNRLAMLVVPNHWGDAPIMPGSAFASRLRGWSDAGIEIFLHGFFHRDDSVHRGILNRARGRLMTAGEGEFLGLPIAEASSRIAAGRSLLQDITGRPVAGFIAPAWLYGFGARRALEEMDIPLAEDHFRVWSPAPAINSHARAGDNLGKPERGSISLFPGHGTNASGAPHVRLEDRRSPARCPPAGNP